jgi:hypothetical protein
LLLTLIEMEVVPPLGAYGETSAECRAQPDGCHEPGRETRAGANQIFRRSQATGAAERWMHPFVG